MKDKIGLDKIFDERNRYVLLFNSRYSWTYVIRILLRFGNLFELDDLANYRIFGYISKI